MIRLFYIIYNYKIDESQTAIDAFQTEKVEIVKRIYGITAETRWLCRNYFYFGNEQINLNFFFAFRSFIRNFAVEW